MPRSSTFFLLSAALSLLSVAARAHPHTPRKGSPERAAIMSALHRALGSGKHTPRVTTDTFNVERGWAYVTGGFDYADGAPLEEEFREGPGSSFDALLHREGKSWRVKRRVYAGDVEEPEFMRDFPQAPRSIFKGKAN